MNNPFWEQQQQMFKMWNDTVTGRIPGMETYENMYKAMMPGMKDYWSNLSSLFPNPGEVWKNMLDAAPGPEAFSEAFSKLWPYKIPGLDAYAKAFDLWKGLGDPASFLQNYQEKYRELTEELFKGFLPAGSATLFTNYRELLDTCVNFYKSVLSPWMKIDESILERIVSGDQSAYTDFFREFNEKYEETFDKVFNMMGMGASREANEEQMKAMGSYIKMLFSAGALASLVINSCGKGMQVLVDRYQNGLKEGKMVTTFREFYDLWYGVNEEVLLELFNTDEFSKAFGDFADKYSQYMIASNKVYERMLEPLPIPTKTDMDSLYLTVYNLRKDVRDLRREMDALKEAQAIK